MTPLQDFAYTVAQARRLFEADRSTSAWLLLYETKQAAYEKLVAALPQVKAIEDFWRYVQSMAPAVWLPLIEREVMRITHSEHFCRDCGVVALRWPERRCAQCRKARRRESYREAKQRARLKRRMRKCPVCKVEGLNPRQRVYLRCQASARRERNRRHQKSLKERKIRRVQSDFTREGNSTISASPIFTLSKQNVDSEGVLMGTLP